MSDFEGVCLKWYESQGFQPKSVDLEETKSLYGIAGWTSWADFIVQAGANAFIIAEAKERWVGDDRQPADRKAERQLQNLALYVRSRHPHARLDFHILLKRGGDLARLGGGYHAVADTDSHGRFVHTLMLQKAPGQGNETVLILGRKVSVFVL